MSHGSFWQRLVRGTRWTWLAERHRAALPADLEATVMELETRDRYHAKQGRSTARVVFHAETGPLRVYLKRHDELPLRARLGALVAPRGRHSPASAEWAHLERVRGLGVAVPEVVAAGERIGPWGALSSFLMVAELTGSLALHEALPELAGSADPAALAAWKRGLARAMADIAARLHGARVFHKDLYLCHFFLEMDEPLAHPPRLTLIDLHRMDEHRWWPDRWRWKDLGQLLFSTEGVSGIDDRDRLRFWVRYRRRLGLRRPRWQLRMIRLKAARYLEHNRPAV
jgi:heptose I phosphotransferase